MRAKGGRGRRGCLGRPSDALLGLAAELKDVVAVTGSMADVDNPELLQSHNPKVPKATKGMYAKHTAHGARKADVHLPAHVLSLH